MRFIAILLTIAALLVATASVPAKAVPVESSVNAAMATFIRQSAPPPFVSTPGWLQLDVAAQLDAVRLSTGVIALWDLNQMEFNAPPSLLIRASTPVAPLFDVPLQAVGGLIVTPDPLWVAPYVAAAYNYPLQGGLMANAELFLQATPGVGEVYARGFGLGIQISLSWAWARFDVPTGSP